MDHTILAKHMYVCELFIKNHFKKRLWFPVDVYFKPLWATPTTVGAVYLNAIYCSTYQFCIFLFLYRYFIKKNIFLNYVVRPVFKLVIKKAPQSREKKGT